MNRASSPSEGAQMGLGVLTAIAPRSPFRKGTVIGLQGQPCDSLYVVAQGQILLQRRNSEGEEYVLYLLGPGEIFGEGSLTPQARWLVTARAVTHGAAHVIPAAQLGRFAQCYPELLTRLLPLLGRATERAYERMDLISTTSARERVVGLLRTLAGRHGRIHDGAIWLPLRLSQEELGAMLGLRRETVLRVMAELESQGIIRRENRQGLWIELEAAG